MSDPTAIDRKAAQLRTALERRYPGVFVDITFNDLPAYKGWRISFEARDPQILVRYELASRLSDFEGRSHEGNTEFAGCHWYTRVSERFGIGYHIAIEGELGSRTRDRALTKKMQTQVLRLLKPFIKGTYSRKTPQQGRLPCSY